MQAVLRPVPGRAGLSVKVRSISYVKMARRQKCCCHSPPLRRVSRHSLKSACCAASRQQVDEPGAYYSWSQEEQQVLIEKQATLGNKWGLISSFLPGRTPLAVQQHWYRFLRDKPAVGASSKASEVYAHFLRC